jgi:Glycosyltransferase sugar-binding region containing DXD motif
MMLLQANHLFDSLLPPVAVSVSVADQIRSTLVSGRQLNPPKYQRRRPTLDEITASNVTTCPPGLVFLSNYVHRDDDNNKENIAGMPPLKPTAIPRIVHQTSKSRCVTQEMANTAAKWRFDGWSYYFYDDEAVGRLFASEADSFAQIDALFRACMPHGALKSDVFRYLVLHRYGGIYSDLDSGPNAFDPQIHLPDTVDAFFVVEHYRMLSQYFMASSPKHPVMWYAVQQSVANLLQAKDTGLTAVAMKTGPHALHNAFALFMKDAGVQVGHSQSKSIRAGVYVGTRNRSITVAGDGDNSDEIVERDVFHGTKKRHYRKMNMTHFRDDLKQSSNRSCLSLMYELISADGVQDE